MVASGQLASSVKLPEGEDLNDWIAVNVVDFYNQVNLLYGCITEFCTPVTCPMMSAGTSFEYLWADETASRPVKMSAPQYTDRLMSWIQTKLDDPTIFPDGDGAFPPNFRSSAEVIFKRLFRVYAHIVHSHRAHVVQLEAEPHLNTCLAHFILFSKEFSLIPEKEYAPLQPIVEQIMSQRDSDAVVPLLVKPATTGM